nr:hypothetical protein [uncultured Blautia sp.]
METDHMPGMRRNVLGNATASEYQTVRSNAKGALYILRNKERSKLMEIKYADNVILTVDITEQMLEKFDRRE